MHWFFRYLIARESYRLINNNRASIGSSIGKLFRWLAAVIFHAMMLLLIVGLTVRYSNRHKLLPAELQAGDSLFVIGVELQQPQLLRIYGNSISEISQLSRLDYRIDTLEAASFVDNHFFVGTYTGELRAEAGALYPEVQLSPAVDSSLRVSSAAGSLPFETENTYFSLADVNHRGASPPEQRWLRYAIALLLVYLLLIYLVRTVAYMFTRIRTHNQAVDQLARQSMATQAAADQLLASKQQLQRSMQVALGGLIFGLLALLVVGGYVVYLHTS